MGSECNRHWDQYLGFREEIDFRLNMKAWRLCSVSKTSLFTGGDLLRFVFLTQCLDKQVTLLLTSVTVSNTLSVVHTLSVSPLVPLSISSFSLPSLFSHWILTFSLCLIPFSIYFNLSCLSHPILSLPSSPSSSSSSPSGVRRGGAGAHDLRGLRLPLPLRDASAGHGCVRPLARGRRAARGLLRRGDGQRGLRLQVLLHGAPILAQPLRERVEDGETQEAGAGAPQGRHSLSSGAVCSHAPQSRHSL